MAHAAGRRLDATQAVVRPALAAWDEKQAPERCPGCGVKMQESDPNKPGFFVRPKEKSADAKEEIEESLESSFRNTTDVLATPKTNETDDAKEEEVLDVVCARCYSLQHYGRIKSIAAEAELPGFDLERIVGNRIAREKGRRAVICCVVDAADFDASLPIESLRQLLVSAKLLEETENRLTREGRSAAHIVLAVTKSDLLPKQCGLKRLEGWYRRRYKAQGLPLITAVHLVSAQTGAGMPMLLEGLEELCGKLGDVWVIGAQNAGKSSLINAMHRCISDGDVSKRRALTEAAVPGTTIGIVQLSGILPTARCRVFDTPGVLHTHQITTLLSAAEVRMILPRRALKPRTFRCEVGGCISLGACARVEVLSAPSSTIYMTFWGSDEIVCHMGKAINAPELWSKHAGITLQPPVGGNERCRKLPELEMTEVDVFGNSWKESSVDVCIAGFGWVGIGVGGQCRLRVWTFPSVEVCTREAMIPDFAKQFETPGFTKALIPKKKNKKAKA